MINWIKDKLGITQLEFENLKFKQAIKIHEYFVANKIAELKEYTRVDADIGFRGNNTIILTGVYRNKAYIRFYDLGDAEFLRLVEQLKEMRQHALLRNIDCPYEFRGTFEV
jgi:hypothetical protein